MEASPHHSEYGIRFVIEQQLAPENRGIPAKSPLPQSIAEQQRAGGAFAIIGWAECPSQQRLHSQQGQHAAIDLRDGEPLGVTLAYQVHLVGVVRSQGFKGAVPVFPIAIVGRRKLQARRTGHGLPQFHQPLGLREGKGPQQYLVGQREGRGIGSHSQRHHQHGSNSEPGSAPQRTRGMAEILAQDVGVHCRGVAEHFEERADPQRGQCGCGGVPKAAREDGAHFTSIFMAEGSGVEMKEKPVEAHHALPGTKPLARAMLTRPVRRRASARATAVPNGVIR